jgi:hypothetical protein
MGREPAHHARHQKILEVNPTVSSGWGEEITAAQRRSEFSWHAGDIQEVSLELPECGLLESALFFSA